MLLPTSRLCWGWHLCFPLRTGYILRIFGLYSFSIVLLHCVDAGFCYNPLENVEVSVLLAIIVVRFRLQVPSLLPCVAVHTSAQLTRPLLHWSGLSHTCVVHREPETRVVPDPEVGHPFSSSLHSGYSTPFQLPKASFSGSSTKKDGVSITFSAVCPDVLLSEWAPPRGNSTRYRGFTSILLLSPHLASLYKLPHFIFIESKQLQGNCILSIVSTCDQWEGQSEVGFCHHAWAGTPQ